MNIVLLGPPGAGKGTQAQFICDRLEIPQISTGDMLRSAYAAGTELGIRAKAIMDTGELVSDDVILGIVRERLQEPDCTNGCLFDGFPRTIAQADGLVEIGAQIDVVLELQLDDQAIVERMSGRRVHEGSGRVYHIKFDPPRKEGVDDVTGEPLLQRSDDLESTVRERLRVYREQTAPLIDYYRNTDAKYLEIDGSGTVESIRDSISEALS